MPDLDENELHSCGSCTFLDYRGRRHAARKIFAPEDYDYEYGQDNKDEADTACDSDTQAA